MNLDLIHSINQYLESSGAAAAEICDDGLVFDVDGSEVVCDMGNPPAAVEVFADAGYVDGETLNWIRESDDDLDLDEYEASDIVTCWSEEGFDWALGVERSDGMATLSLFLPAVPNHPSDWERILATFGNTRRAWCVRIESRSAELPEQQPGGERSSLRI